MPHEMSIADITGSLDAKSAKIWPRERTEDNSEYLLIDDQLKVSRWTDNNSDPAIAIPANGAGLLRTVNGRSRERCPGSMVRITSQRESGTGLSNS